MIPFSFAAPFRTRHLFRRFGFIVGGQASVRDGGGIVDCCDQVGGGGVIGLIIDLILAIFDLGTYLIE